MIEWIALALSADAEGKASAANEKADYAIHNSNGISPGDLVIVRPVDLITIGDDVRNKGRGFWRSFFCGEYIKKVLSDKPWATLSIKRSDIENLAAYEDDDGNPFVRMAISKYANVIKEGNVQIGLYIRGKLEDVTAILNGRSQ